MHRASWKMGRAVSNSDGRPAKAIAQPLIVQLVGFGETDAGGAIHAANDRRIISGREGHQDCRLAVIRRCEPGGLNRGGGGSITPVVVGAGECAVAIVKLVNGILDGARYRQAVDRDSGAKGP